MILTEGVHDWYTGFEPTIPWAAFARQLRIFRCGGREVEEAALIAAIVIEKEQTRWLNGKI
jgi:hypothetical protein